MYDRVAVYLKLNTSSIKQTWRTGPIHQRAAWISYWVQLCRDKCRTSSVCPRLPIDRDHHCDVAFYLTTCSLKLYIILFPTQRSHRRRRRVEKGTSVIVSYILRAYGHHLFKPFSWLLMITPDLQPQSFKGSGICTCCCHLFHFRIIPRQMNIILVNMSLLAKGFDASQHKPYSPSAALIQICQIRLRGKPTRLLLICAIMEFHANKLS